MTSSSAAEIGRPTVSGALRSSSIDMNPASGINPSLPQNVQAGLQLRDIPLPLSPELWPPAPGWWLLVITLVVLLCLLSVWLFRLWRRRRLQKEAMATLEALNRDYSEAQVPQFLAALSVLLRRVALMKYPRRQVAALTGRDWLSFLDQHGGEGQYSLKVDRSGDTACYARHSEVDKDALLLLSRKWIRQNMSF